MDKETREQIALIRYKIISPVLAEPARLQNEYFRSQARKEHMFPHYGIRNDSSVSSVMERVKKRLENDRVFSRRLIKGAESIRIS
jgi:hypothetical protein